MGLQIKSVGRKNNLIISLIAVFALVMQPIHGLVAHQVANALGVVDGHTLRVSTADDLRDALATESINHITLDADIDISQGTSLILSRSNVTINGNDKTITGPDLGGSWVNNGENYALKIYNASNIRINSLRVTGANAGIQINGSQVELRGHTWVGGNVFGGIELSRGSGVAAAPTLTHHQGSILNSSESNGKPTIWTVGDATVDSTATQLTKATHIKANQTQYYLSVANANIAATNTTQSKTYASVEAATDAASEGDKIRLEKDITLGNPTIRIRNAVVLDGNGKTISTTIPVPQDRGPTNGLYNAAIIVLSNDVEIKNLTIDGSQTNRTAHGIVVNTGHTGVKVSNVTVRNGAAGLIVNGAEVTVTDIKTSNNSWYGINVDKKDGASATLTINGTSTHQEGAKAHIYADKADDVDASSVTVTDTNSQYNRSNATNNNGGRAYVYSQKLAAPVITNSPVYVNASEPYDYATWDHSGVNVAQFEYREYRNLAEANADTDGNNYSYWSPKSPASARQQQVGHSWTSSTTLYYRVVAIDAFGNRSKPSELGTVIIDKTAPAAPTNLTWRTSAGINIGNNGHTNLVGGTALWQDASGDDVRYLYTYWNEIAGNSYKETSRYRPSAINGLSMPGSFTEGEGVHLIQVFAVDKAGNVSAGSDILKVTYDKTPPTISIDLDTLTNPTVAQIIANDTNLNRIDVSLWKEGVSSYVAFPGEWTSPTDFDKDYASRLNLAGLSDGNYTIRATASDVAKNPKNAVSVNFTIDRTAPDITIESATPSLITGTVGADAEKVLVRVGDQPEQEATIGEDGKTWTLTISPALTASTTVTARAVDAAGNANSEDTNPVWATADVSITQPEIEVDVEEVEVINSEQTSGRQSTLLTRAAGFAGGFTGFLNANTVINDNTATDDATDEDGEVAAAVTNNDDNGEVKAAEDVKDSWSLINLLLTIGIGVASIISLLGLLGSNRKDRKLASRLLTIVPAAGAVVALLLIEDFSGSMIWVNVWSLLIGALAVIQMIILGMSKPTANE